MATHHEVSCIRKRDRQSPHERIHSIGGVNPDRTRWELTEDKAIAAIENNIYQFFVFQGGRKVYLVIATHNGRKYLKTQADDFSPNNLLSLASCPL